MLHEIALADFVANFERHIYIECQLDGLIVQM